MPPNPDREFLPVELVQPRPAPLAQARRWQAAHPFGLAAPSEHPRLSSWRGSSAEKRAGPWSPECLALLHELRAPPTTPVKFLVPRANLKESPGGDQATLGAT